MCKIFTSILFFVGHTVLLGNRDFLRSWYGLFWAPGPDSSATISAGMSSSTESIERKRKQSIQQNISQPALHKLRPQVPPQTPDFHVCTACCKMCLQEQNRPILTKKTVKRKMVSFLQKHNSADNISAHQLVRTSHIGAKLWTSILPDSLLFHILTHISI